MEFLEAQRDQAVQTIRTRGEELITAFREEAAQAKKKILASLSEGSELRSSPTDDITLTQEPSLVADVKREVKQSVDVLGTTVHERRSYGEMKTIHIVCTGGVYSGQRFTLVLAMDANRTCHIGRSSGKKYKAPHGLSLPKDPEISTSHAELRWNADDDHIYITDQNSTNGTKLNGRNLKSRVAVRLDFSKPIRLGFGGCDFTFTM
ncbi:hypothetical protein, variant 2 [Aphanomyces invadans]|nr:hypothetical protein, variant 2 [Aphanomyces invadans]ETW05719.1 hypothetical protein, variant 2 [Aphanomyces invadans]|eukprot:XP_008865497.1 hypothetical protein, variant 2 [Aphanomyces invadans]